MVDRDDLIERRQEQVQDAVGDLLRAHKERCAEIFLRSTRGVISCRERAAMCTAMFFPITEEAVRYRDWRDRHAGEDATT